MSMLRGWTIRLCIINYEKEEDSMEKTTEIEVNTEKIMCDIRRKLMLEEEKSLPTFESVRDSLPRALHFINKNNQINYFWSFGPKTPVTFIKRVIRKVIQCVMMPVIMQQNALNKHFVNCMNVLQRLNEENIALQRDVALLQERVQEQDALLKELLKERV